jgi:hypothetical protein
MNRLAASGFHEPIAVAMGQLTPRLQERLQHVHFLVGVDPFFIGFAGADAQRSYTSADGKTFSYNEMAACWYPHHQTHLASADRRTTIVIPTWRRYSDPVGVVVHELGHALHEMVGFDWIAEPITSYAHENHREAFAEAFEETMMGRPARLLVDERTAALFASLS